MPNEIHSIHFGNIVLEMEFIGKDYETSSVKFKTLHRERGIVLEESPAVPIRCLYDATYLMEWSLRRNAALEKQEALRIEELNKQKEGK